MERKDSGTREIKLEFEWDEEDYNTGTCFCRLIPQTIPKGKMCVTCPKVRTHIKLETLEVQDANS